MIFSISAKEKVSLDIDNMWGEIAVSCMVRDNYASGWYGFDEDDEDEEDDEFECEDEDCCECCDDFCGCGWFYPQTATGYSGLIPHGVVGELNR